MIKTYKYNTDKTPEVLKRQLKKLFERLRDKYGCENSEIESFISYSVNDFIKNKMTLTIEFNSK